MGWTMKALVGALALALSGGPASAAIHVLSFSGTGTVTLSREGNFDGVPILVPVERGAPVVVTGYFDLGDGSRPDLAPIVPDGFTGTVLMDRNAISSGYQRFVFNATGGGVERSVGYAVFVPFVKLNLLNGNLASFSFAVDYDPEFIFADQHSFYEKVGSAKWGGYWHYDQPDSMVPEPAAWALLIMGFTLAGTSLRQRSHLRSKAQAS